MIIVGVCCAVLQGQGSPPHWDEHRGRDLPTLLTACPPSESYSWEGCDHLVEICQ